MDPLMDLLIGFAGMAALVSVVSVMCAIAGGKADRLAERLLTMQPPTVNGWRQRPDAEPLRGRDLRCYQPIPRRETA